MVHLPDGNFKYILHAIDHRSRFNFLAPLERKNSIGIKKEFTCFGAPSIFHSIIYKEAGVVKNRVEPFNPSLQVNMVSLPNQQPGANKQATENDPLIHIKIPLAGDQLTRVTFAGANTHL